MKILRPCTLFVLLCMSLLGQSLASQNDKLSTLLDEIWQYELSVSPLTASQQGDRRLDNALPDLSESALKANHQQWLKFKTQLLAIDDSALSETARINKLMQLYKLNDAISEFEFNAYWVPITSEYGFHSAMASLPNLASFKDKEGAENYLARLQAIPTYFAQNMAWMEKGIAAGMTQPKAVMEGFEASIEAYVTTPEESLFYAPLENLGPHFNEETKQALQQRAKDIIENQVVAAYRDLYTFFVDTYIPAAMDMVGAQHWPNGKAYYENRARHYTTTDMSAEDIHQLGLQEVARIRSEMQVIIDELEFDGDFASFIAFLRTDPQFYAKTPEDLIAYASFVAKRMDAQLPALFEKLPRTPYGVAPVPDAIAPKYTTGRYISPRNDREPGYYWVNTYALNKRPLYAIPALTLHEAVPGHHLQIMLANENDDLPPVRKTYISAFGEGWGLYSEYLGIEAGIYETPYDNFGRLSYEMWRACRLVVDTGMHMMGWSRQQGIDFMLENTALSEHNVRTEIDRYISWPAQALSYKIGEIRIRELRKKAELALKDKFDIRQFHSAVLEHGSVPLYVLEQNIDSYIEEHKQ